MLGNFDIHNPGNIRKSSDLFKGEVRPSSNINFKEFKNNEYGYRAMFLILSTYLKKGYNTIFSIIARWAPTFENDTADYISFVSNRMKKSANTKLAYNQLATLIYYMTWYENGFPGNRDEIAKAYVSIGNNTNINNINSGNSAVKILFGGAASAFLIYKIFQNGNNT